MSRTEGLPVPLLLLLPCYPGVLHLSELGALLSQKVPPTSSACGGFIALTREAEKKKCGPMFPLTEACCEY